MARAWQCELCGYVHQGDAPPESCPICGAEQEAFAPLTVVAEPLPVPPADAWRCGVCDHLADGAQPPAQCPVCGAPAQLFTPAGAATPLAVGSQVRRLVVVGAGIAGLTAAGEARLASPEIEIVLVSRESSLPYYRLNLTRYLAGEVDLEALLVRQQEWFRQQRISWHPGEAVALERERGRVLLRSGETLDYDRLILANGSHPFVPPLAGVTRDGVTVLRTLADARAIEARLRPGLRCVCIGGGLLGLETAGALVRRGLQVAVLEGQPWLLPRQLPQRGGERLQRLVEDQSIAVRCGVEVRELTGDEAVRGVRLADGSELAADLVILSAGVRPNSHLARQGGLKVATGVLVDDRLITSDPAILAAGDIAEHRGRLYGIWPASYAQGVVAGRNAVGAEAEFPGIPPSTRLKVLNCDLFSVGRLDQPDASYRLCEIEDENGYRGLVCHDGRVTGAALLGNTELAGELTEAVRGEVALARLPTILAHFPQLTADGR